MEAALSLAMGVLFVSARICCTGHLPEIARRFVGRGLESYNATQRVTRCVALPERNAMV